MSLQTVQVMPMEQRAKLLNSIAEQMAKRGSVSAAIAGADGIPVGVLQVKDRRDGYTFIVTPRFNRPRPGEAKQNADEIKIRFSQEGKPLGVEKRVFTQTVVNGRPSITSGPAQPLPSSSWPQYINTADPLIQRFARDLERLQSQPRMPRRP